MPWLIGRCGDRRGLRRRMSAYLQRLCLAVIFPFNPGSVVVSLDNFWILIENRVIEYWRDSYEFSRAG
ncbi:MAG: hypothetical protein PWQ96_150 [Clostridia bacterium]|jgi:hypothetical protein|nr:hypothetical protein [Clostridia bacterium]